MNHSYEDQINNVIQYIEHNSHRKLSLDTLADVSNFSKYHFTRIFSAYVGVTPVAYVNQVRLQMSIPMLLETNKTILEVASQCGFESISTYNALFKKRYCLTPSEMRSSARKDRNFSLYASNKGEEIAPEETYNGVRNNSLLERAWSSMITIKQIPDVAVAAVRHVGSYMETREAWNKLGEWVEQQGLTLYHPRYIGISLDDGNFVEEHVCKYDACVTVTEEVMNSRHPSHIQFKTLSGGLYAVYRYYDTVENLVLAYQTVFGLWLPHSEYEADDRYCLEWCLNDPAKDPEGKLKVDLHIPIRLRN